MLNRIRNFIKFIKSSNPQSDDTQKKNSKKKESKKKETKKNDSKKMHTYNQTNTPAVFNLDKPLPSVACFDKNAIPENGVQETEIKLRLEFLNINHSRSGHSNDGQCTDKQGRSSTDRMASTGMASDRIDSDRSISDKTISARYPFDIDVDAPDIHSVALSSDSHRSLASARIFPPYPVAFTHLPEDSASAYLFSMQPDQIYPVSNTAEPSPLNVPLNEPFAKSPLIPRGPNVSPAQGQIVPRQGAPIVKFHPIEDPEPLEMHPTDAQARGTAPAEDQCQELGLVALETLDKVKDKVNVCDDFLGCVLDQLPKQAKEQAQEDVTRAPKVKTRRLAPRESTLSFREQSESAPPLIISTKKKLVNNVKPGLGVDPGRRFGKILIKHSECELDRRSNDQINDQIRHSASTPESGSGRISASEISRSVEKRCSITPFPYPTTLQDKVSASPALSGSSASGLSLNTHSRSISGSSVSSDNLPEHDARTVLFLMQSSQHSQTNTSQKGNVKIPQGSQSAGPERGSLSPLRMKGGCN